MRIKDDLYKKQWLVYAKQPMGNAGQVVEYFVRYSNKVAISNYRILELTEISVRFQYKDYADHKNTKTIMQKRPATACCRGIAHEQGKSRNRQK